MQIGYARISTKEQNLNLQYEAFSQINCDRVFEDKISGIKSSRKGLNKAFKILKKGDTLIVWKLDRLSRSVKDLVIMVGKLEKRGIHFKSITDNIDTSTPTGRFFFHIMASFSQMERELLIERTLAGLEIARKQGRIGGRKRKMTDSKLLLANKLFAEGHNIKDISLILKLSVPTIYRWIPANKQSL